MQATIRTSLAIAVFCVAPPALEAQVGIPAGQFGPLRELIRPQEGESKWRQIEWLTSLHEARVKAAAEGKPILLWSGGGAPPVGGC
jgi:hypothetical protein